MAVNTVRPPFTVFQDVDGTPLEGGYIYIGVLNLDAQANPKAAFFDNTLSTSAPQPIRTIGGFPRQAGAASQLFVDGDYSIKVLDKNQALVYANNNAADVISITDLSGIYATVSLLLASTEAARGVGAIWNAQGFRYVEAASAATDQHVTTSGGVKLYVQADTEGYDAIAFGADPTGVADSTAAIQKAIDAASANNVGNVWIRGKFLCNDRLVMKRGANLRGNWHQSTASSDFISRITFVNLSGVNKRACLVLDRAEDPNISFVEYSGIQFAVSSANGGWESIVYNKEVHWHRVRQCYFSGIVTGAVFWWGAVLYPLVEDCIFSIQSCTVFFDGRETNYDITYYGVNWGLVQNNSIFGGFDVFWGNGLIRFDGNNIESGSTAAARAVVRVYGPSVANITLENNYLEWGGGLSHIWVNCEPGGQGVIISRNNYAPLRGGSIAFKTNALALSIDTDADYFGAAGQIVQLPSSAAFVNMGRTRVFGSASLKPGRWWQGTPAWRGTHVTSNNNGSRYLRSEEEIVRSQFIERTIWQNGVFNAPGPQRLLLGRGDNISVNFGGGVALEDHLIDHLEDAGLYPGARVTIAAAGTSFTLRHNRSGGIFSAWTDVSGDDYTTASVAFTGGGGSGAAATASIRNGSIEYIEITNEGSGYTSAPTMTITGDGSGAVGACVRFAPFILAKGADATLPGIRAIEFIVFTDRTLREVGDYSVRL